MHAVHRKGPGSEPKYVSHAACAPPVSRPLFCAIFRRPPRCAPGAASHFRPQHPRRTPQALLRRPPEGATISSLDVVVGVEQVSCRKCCTLSLVSREVARGCGRQHAIESLALSSARSLNPGTPVNRISFSPRFVFLRCISLSYFFFAKCHISYIHNFSTIFLKLKPS